MGMGMDFGWRNPISVMQLQEQRMDHHSCGRWCIMYSNSHMQDVYDLSTDTKCPALPCQAISFIASSPYSAQVAQRLASRLLSGSHPNATRRLTDCYAPSGPSAGELAGDFSVASIIVLKRSSDALTKSYPGFASRNDFAASGFASRNDLAASGEANGAS